MLKLSSFEILNTFQEVKMHSLDQNTASVPAFIIKLWKLVEDQDCDDLISWTDKESSFFIRQQATFARDLLPKYFKHNNMASFIRQLNMYGFRKVVNYDKGALTVDNDEMEFYHPFFLKGSEDLLELIKRKIPTSKGAELNSNPKDILTDLTVIREKQESMNNILIGMKKENELLWRELSSLRQKHKTQEQIIQKVIHFLVSIVQSSKQNIGVKRKITHMLQDSTATSTKRSRGLVDVVRGKKPDFFFSVSDDDKATSPDGPVIHEVTEFDHEDSVDFEDSLHSSSKSKRGRAETIAHVASPQSSSASVASPADSLKLLEPVSSQISILPYEKVEEVLGLPIDDPAESTISTTNDVSNVISIPEISAKNMLSPQILDLLISSSDGKSNIISLPEGAQLISVAPDTAGNISLAEGHTNLNNPQVVLSSNDISFPPSTVTVVREDVGACNKSSIVQLADIGSTKCSELERSILSPTVKIEGKPKSFLKSSQSQSSSKKDGFLKVENQENAMQNNFPLTLSDSSSSTELAKNAISNHILDVDQDLDWLHGQLNSGGFDSSMLLELFSSDEAANNAAQTCQLNSDDCILRDTDSNIIGNELVQFTPSILDIDFDDMENPILMDYLNESTDAIMEDASASSSLQTPPSIKAERIESTSSCVFGNSVKTNPNPPTPRGRKTSRGRGKRKSK